MRSFFDCMTPIFSPADRPLPVVCSGQWGGQAVETYERTGRTSTSCIWAAAASTATRRAGGRRAATRQAWAAAEAGVPWRRAQDHPELAATIEKFG